MIRSFFIKQFAAIEMRKTYRDAAKAIDMQTRMLQDLVHTSRDTKFGREHHFGTIRSYEDFQSHVPVRDYEGLKSYMDLMVDGGSDILWPGRPTYLAKTSGTTSGTKYIPMTKASTPHHVATARNSVFAYVRRTGQVKFLSGKLLYLSGSPVLTKTEGVLTGRLSGIVNHQIPSWLQGNKLPTRSVNEIDAWETKVQAIVEESYNQDVTLIGGIPPWVQMYYEALLDKTGASTVKEVFPNLQVFVYGGVNFEPYRSRLEELVGGRVDSIETYPASEGFLAYQDGDPDGGLLLNVNAGIFYEFIPLEEYGSDNPRRLLLDQVELGVQYAIILTTNAGLWAYSIGDSVEFVSLDPFRIRVSGRVKHFISAFGEHVIGKEVDEAMIEACQQLQLKIEEFTVAPQVTPSTGLPYHEWFVACHDIPDIDQLSLLLDQRMQQQNVYYRDLIEGKVLRPAVVTHLQPDAFRRYMESQGKLGGQNKVPRLSNDRQIVDQLGGYVLKTSGA